MKFTIGLVIGAFVAVSLYYHIPRQAAVWFARGDSDRLPQEYPGVRIRTWVNGEETFG